MKICLISDYRGILDEGMRNVAYHYISRLSARHEVLHLCLRPISNLLKPGFWSAMRIFGPDIIHFIPGSTFNTFALTRLFRLNCPRAKTVFSALHPVLSPLSERLVPYLQPDMTLTQSHEAEQMFKSLGFKTRFLLNGVDTDKFVPVTSETKQALRRKYNLEPSNFIVLHVGHLQKGRNLLALQALQKLDKVQILIVGSVSCGSTEQDIYQRLKNNGFTVWNSYFTEIQEMYALSDCYIFPTFNRRNCVEFPLSIMEAMSCNLPVVSTSFASVPQIFKAGQGLYFASCEADFVPLVKRIFMNKESVETREKVLSLSWGNIVDKLERVYAEVLNGKLR